MQKLGLWGYHINEYRDMFGLSEEDLKSCLLEYGCGPTAINAELSKVTNNSVISCDPMFSLDQAALFAMAFQEFEKVKSHLGDDQTKFNFSRYGSLDALIATRRQGLKEFFVDYEKGKADKRYLPVVDGHLPFSDFAFDLALSSHYLFVNDDKDIDFHLQVIHELARVAKEVRIFPLIDHWGQPSPLLGPVLLGLQQANYGVEVREVTFQLQPFGNAMLRVWAQQCQVA